MLYGHKDQSYAFVVVIIVTALNNAAPSYISDLFTERQTSVSLRGKRRLVIDV